MSTNSEYDQTHVQNRSVDVLISKDVRTVSQEAVLMSKTSIARKRLGMFLVFLIAFALTLYGAGVFDSYTPSSAVYEDEPGDDSGLILGVGLSQVSGYANSLLGFRFIPPEGWWFLRAFEESVHHAGEYLTSHLGFTAPYRIPLRERAYFGELNLLVDRSGNAPASDPLEYTTSHGYHVRFYPEQCDEDQGGETIPRSFALEDTEGRSLFVKTEGICGHIEHPDLDVFVLMKSVADGFEFIE